MRRIALAVGAVLLGGAVAAAPAEGQVRFGTQIDWGEDTDFGIGARLGFQLGESLKAKGISGLVTFDYFFPDGFDYWEVAANGVYDFKTSSTTRPYVGGGLSLARIDVDLGPGLSGGDSELGLNLFGGLKFNPLGNVVPFVEARYAIRDGSQFVLAAGVYFGKP